MNMYDTEVAEGLLGGQGYQIVSEGLDPLQGEAPADPHSVSNGADVVLMNTCSVREHAEDRVYGRLGKLKKEKQQNPDMIIGLMGCMVEEHREKLFKKFPHLDLMVGTRNIKELPALIEEVRQNRRQVAKIRHEGISIEYTDQILRKGDYHAWLPIMTGCNKVCTFCIVPITRGSEVSMNARDVYREASRLVDEGVRWITLLGQNVNSYDGSGIASLPIAHRNDVIVSIDGQIAAIPQRGTQGKAGIASAAKQSKSSFPELLDMLCEIEGLEHISFTTSHPQDATEELYRVIAQNPKISRRFHLPLQSGSDRMLKRMKRLHTYEEYREKIRLMREMIPDISITTDIIAGFSGESPEDHQATCRALEELRYDGAYIYKYSVRPGTPAAKLEDDVPLVEKEKRNAELLEIQKKISVKNHQRFFGRTMNVFVEGVSAKNDTELCGRSPEEKKVVFPGSRELLGSHQKVLITAIHHETLIGTRVTP